MSLSHEPTTEGEEFVSQLTRSQPALQVFISGLTPTRGDAEDVLQNVNLALWRKRESYRSDQDFLPWAFGFAMMEIRKFRERTGKCRLRFDDVTIGLLAADYPSVPTFVEDRHEALFRCLEKLAARERRVVTEFYASGASAQQIANQSNLSLNTVYKVLTRARKALRTCVQRSLLQRERASLPPTS